MSPRRLPFLDEMRGTLRLAGPVVAAQLAQISMGFVDTVMVGRLGQEALAGVALGNTAFFVVRVEPFERYRVFSRLRTPDLTYFRELVRIGGPIGVSSGIESGLFMITALLMGMLGTTALAAHQVALQCAAFTFMVPLSVGIAGSVRVGQAVGRGRPGDARLAGYAAMVLAGSFMLGAAVLFWTVPEFIVGLYLDMSEPANADVAALAVSLLSIAAVFQVFDGVQVAAMGVLRGLKDTRVPMLIAVATYWGVGLSTGYGLGLVLGWGAEGLWWGLVVGLATASVLLAVRFHRCIRRTPPPVDATIQTASVGSVTPPAGRASTTN